MVNIVFSKFPCFAEVTPLKLRPCVPELAGQVARSRHVHHSWKYQITFNFQRSTPDHTNGASRARSVQSSAQRTDHTMRQNLAG